MKIILNILIFLAGIALNAQTVLTISGQTYIDSTDTWMGVNIPRSVPAKLVFKNNSVTSVNASGYILQAGDEDVAATNNNLDGEVITGNKFTWNGTDMTSITHGIFTGYNKNSIVQYNYCDKIPMGIIRKSNGMTDVSGAIAYNILINPVAVGIVVKGMNGVKICNNTFISTQTQYSGPGKGTPRGLIDVYMNTDIEPFGSATGTKIYNNIFYTVNQILNIYIYEKDCLTDFESDYNVFYCESGTPLFRIDSTIYTFAQWQALGFDTHSVVINPNFKDFINFVPASRLDYGKNLGFDWINGLSTDAKWGVTDPETTAQNGTWQVGAIVYGAQANQSPVISISSPAKSTSFLSPATIIIDAVASDPDGTISTVEFFQDTVKLGEITSFPYSYTWKDVPEGTYSLTAIATDDKNMKTVSAAIYVTVKNQNSDIFNLSPNPNHGCFSIDLFSSLPDENNNVTIINLAGKAVYNGIITEEENTRQFDLSYLNSGIYIMMISSNQIVLTKKFIKN